MDKKTAAMEAYSTICKTLDARGWKYNKEPENLTVYLGVTGDDMPMNFLILVDEDRQLVRIMSPMQFAIKKELRIEGAVASCAASYGLRDGSFDYDMESGKITYRMCHTIRGSLLSMDAIKYMIDCACTIVDHYNDQFLAINNGCMSIQEFLEKEHG